MQKQAFRKKILIIDDDFDLSGIVSDMYEDYGFDVSLALNAAEAYEILKNTSFHMILLDINLPVGTGFEICKDIRKLSTVPIIFASARTSEEDKITGLDMGGDDYLPKPYSLKELLSRTNSLIRRTYGFHEPEGVIVFGEGTRNHIILDKASRSVTRNGGTVGLSLKEFDLFSYLAGHMGEAVKKECLLSEVWGAFSEVEMSTLTVHIRWLREKLEENPSQPVYIKTVWGVGYMAEDSTGEEST